MKRSRLITNRAMDGLGGMIVLTITVLSGAVLLVLAGSMLDRMRAEHPEPDLSLCPFCEQPVQH